MTRPTIDNTHALFQAGATIGTYLGQAIHEIDQRLGEGYAKSHPQLLAEAIRCQTLDFNNTCITDVLFEIASSIDALSHAVDTSTS